MFAAPLKIQFKFISGFFPLLLLVIFFLPALQTAAQADERTEQRKKQFERFRSSDQRPFSKQRPYYLIRWEAMQPGGLKIVRKLDDQSAVIELEDSKTLHSLQPIASVYPANDGWKLSPFFQEKTGKDGKVEEYIISATRLDELLEALKRFQEVTIVQINRPSASLVITCNPRQFTEEILGLPQIIFADIRVAARVEIGIIGYNRSLHGLSALDYTLPGANGKQIVVGVKEQRMEVTDLDLHKRVLSSTLAAGDVTNHATVVATIIGGAGNSFYDGRGVAWACRFFSSSFNQLFADDSAVLSANRVSVQNHSYGTVIQSFYGAEALSYDAQTWTDKSRLHIFSAGNQGEGAAGSGAYNGLSGFANITGNFKAAKNVVTVGAIDNKNNLPAASSSGPLYDGRLAPQLVALGPGGTSDAAAVVSGTAAVIQQVYADSNLQQIPPASLVKAVLFNTADDIFRKGIDYKTGFGLLNSLEAVKAVQQKKTDGGVLLQGQEWTRNFNVPAGAATFKVTLCWTDTAAAVNNNRAIVNDLDLLITETATGTVYRPWVLNSAAHADSLAKPAIRGRDSLNTAEQVSISLPVGGHYECKVKGNLVQQAGITFHIAYAIDTLNTFQFISPQHSADLNREENPVLDIRWRAFVADTNQTGNLYITYDNGSNWQLIRAGTKIHTGYYPWLIKDTSSIARIRMETPFGNFSTTSFVISKQTRSVVDFICADSLRLSWNRHVYASGYKIYALTDSAYLRHLYTVTDSFTVIRRSQYPQQVFAVEPVLNNGIPAARSIASDVNLQGVKCFYKTFYHVLQDGNTLQLFLELSAPSYCDTVYFELVNAAGQLIRTVGVQPTNTLFLYRQLVNGIPQGTSYWRAKIRLKNGAIVVTETIAVLSSGNQKIIFYPNPASRDQPIHWVLEQGVAASSSLQLFDISGRMLVNYNELPPTIDIRQFQPGMMIYKLLDTAGQVISTGKLIVL